MYAYVSRGVLARFVTELTLIEDGILRYRGVDAVEISRTRSFEEAATWLWDATWPVEPPRWTARKDAVSVISTSCAALDSRCPPADRWRVAVAAAATTDPMRHDHSPVAVTSAAGRLLTTLVDTLPMIDKSIRRPPDAMADLAARLWPRLSPLAPTAAHIGALDAALVLMADHELAPSTLAARTAAAFGADPYAVVLTGMASASGPYHAASSLEVRPVIARAALHGPAVALAEVLNRGVTVHGFGHPLYPQGDPRAAKLLLRLRSLPTSLEAVDSILTLAADRGMPLPNCDFALAALAEVGHMVPGASEAIFILGRVAGWIGHAMEEYAQRSSFRVRATYVGRR